MNDLKKRLLFVLIVIIVYRIGSHIPIPLLDVKLIINSFENENTGIFSLFNLFSGGALSKITIFSLGIMPYISSSIVIQLLGAVWNPIKNLKKDGELGRQKITDYTRLLTVVLSIFQSIAMAKFMLSISVINTKFLLYITIVLTLVSGTLFLMWLGEQINENGIGNGISLIIFTSIVSNIPRTFVSSLEKVRQGEIEIIIMILFIMILILIVFFIVFMEQAQRKILINYSKRQQGKRLYSAQSTYLPFKINMSGVIPPIFASSIILFPMSLMQWFDNTFINHSIFGNIKHMFLPGKPLYIALFGISIIFFCFFYTTLIFNAKETADNLKKSNGFISGIRPGNKTALYIKKIIYRLTIIGSLYLLLVSLLPEILILFTNIPFYFGGTSLLIVVVVIIDFISQVQNKLLSYKYNNLIKKYKIKN